MATITSKFTKNATQYAIKDYESFRQGDANDWHCAAEEADNKKTGPGVIRTP